MTKLFAAALLGVALLAAPAAFADDAKDNILRAETQIAALNPADATAASGMDYQAAKLRLDEARAAEERNRKEESMWRSSEALRARRSAAGSRAATQESTNSANRLPDR